MKIVTGILIAALWLGCGHVARGYWIGDFTMQFPDQEQERAANIQYVFGPAGLVAAVIMGMTQSPYMEHGYTCQQRWDAFKRSASVLGKDYFVHWGGNQHCNAEELR